MLDILTHGLNFEPGVENNARSIVSYLESLKRKKNTPKLFFFHKFSLPSQKKDKRIQGRTLLDKVD
jgi:hypothetical protein